MLNPEGSPVPGWELAVEKSICNAMRKVAAGKALAINAVMATLLVIVTVFSSGMFAMWAVISVGLCNSIMFPTIPNSRLGQLMSSFTWTE
jgi:fucose permease